MNATDPVNTAAVLMDMISQQMGTSIRVQSSLMKTAVQGQQDIAALIEKNGIGENIDIQA